MQKRETAKLYNYGVNYLVWGIMGLGGDYHKTHSQKIYKEMPNR